MDTYSSNLIVLIKILKDFINIYHFYFNNWLKTKLEYLTSLF